MQIHPCQQIIFHLLFDFASHIEHHPTIIVDCCQALDICESHHVVFFVLILNENGIQRPLVLFEQTTRTRFYRVVFAAVLMLLMDTNPLRVLLARFPE
jgi:hypothetical protein